MTSNDLSLNRTPDWAINDFLELADGQLVINGALADALVAAYGSPLYVFSAPRIRHNSGRLLNAAATNLSRPARFFYASKANSNMAILRAIKECGIDIEVNSGGELFKALRVGFSPDQIIFNGTSKTDEELDEAVRAEILSINVDSIYELELITNVARRCGKRANVTLRLVPEVATRSHAGLQTALHTSKFGISASQVQEAFRLALQQPDWLNVVGIHIHVGSQTPDAEPYAEAFATMWQHLVELYRATGHALSFVNIGGGVPVNYLRDATQAADFPPHEREMLAAQLSSDEIMCAIQTAADTSARAADAAHLLEQFTFFFEPGRSIISDAGLVLTTVRNIKQRPETDETWLLTDAGYNLMLSMNNYKWYYHLINAGRAAAAHDTPFKVAGPLCDGGDVYFDVEGTNKLPDYRLLPAATAPDDILALLNCGAYSLAQMFPYNGRPLPAAVLTDSGGAVELIRRRDTYEDLLSHDIW